MPCGASSSRWRMLAISHNTRRSVALSGTHWVDEIGVPTLRSRQHYIVWPSRTSA